MVVQLAISWSMSVTVIVPALIFSIVGRLSGAGGSTFSAAAVLSGCASYDNNYLRPEDFAAYLERDGVKVDGTRPLPGDPFRATSGCAIMIDGNEIGVYKYDRSSSVQEKRVETFRESRSRSRSAARSCSSGSKKIRRNGGFSR